MAYRLVFTSAPRSLTGGRSGFCTVARSAGMSEKLAGIVEKIGTYNHERNAGQPVFSHRKISHAGQSYHVLSRISEAQPDYTNRSNYLAEHIVLSASELTGLPTPAEIMLDYKWLAKWEGEPRLLDDIKIEKKKSAYAPPSNTWAHIFGDAGKAALLSDSAPQISASPADANLTLKLFAESAAIYPPELRAWDFTFTTSFSENENPADFKWKAFTGTRAADANAINIIAKTSPSAPANAFADFARSGHISNRDRLGLKVAKPSDIQPSRIHVTASRDKKPFPALAIAVAAILSLAGLAAFMHFYSKSDGSANGDFEFQNKSAPQNIRDFSSGSASATLTYSKVQENVKSLLEENKWREALELWDGAKLDELNPKGRKEILGAIAARADALMDESESLLKNPIKKASQKDIAEKNLKAVKSALDVDGLPNKPERAARLGELEKLIQKP